jgi:WD40 repeat protein
MVVNKSGRIDLFDISNPGRAVKITEITAAAEDAAFTPKGTPRDKIQIISGGRDGAVRQWTLDGMPAAEPFKAAIGRVWSVAFSPDGTRIVSGGEDGTVRLWTLDGKPAADPFKGHVAVVDADWIPRKSVLSVAFSPDGTRIVSTGEDHTVRLWTLDGKPAAEPLEGRVISLAGTRIVSGGLDATIRQWTLDGKPAAEPFKGHDSPVRSVAFSPDGTRIVSGGEDGTVRLWTLDGKPVAEPLKGHDRFLDVYGEVRRAVESVAFSPDGTRIVSGGEDGTVRLWTLDGKPAAEPLKGHDRFLDWTLAGLVYRALPGSVFRVAFSPDGTRIVSGSEDGTVRLWTLDGKPAAEPFKGHRGVVSNVAFSPDGTRFASGGLDGTVRLWMLDGKPATEPFNAGYVVGSLNTLSVAFSPDGTRIVSAVADTVRLWTLDGKPAAEPFKVQHGGWSVLSVALSPDGTRIISGGGDGSVRLWTLDGKPAAEPFMGHSAGVKSVAFSPDGNRIVSHHSDGTVLLWNVAARTRSILNVCRPSWGVGFLRKGQLWVGCSDRIVLQSASFKPLGEIFLSKEGLVASIYSEGVHIPNDRMEFPFRAITAGGSVNWNRHAVPEISVERARQVLLDDWTLSERVYEFAKQTYSALDNWYESLGWLKAPFWPALGWLMAIVTAISIWAFAPHKLAVLAMPRTGSAEIPTWKWLAGVVTLFGFLGTTRRPLRAWLRKNRDALYAENFVARTPVKEREKYSVLSHEAEIALFARDVSAKCGAQIWINGVGGSGKSALSFRIMRTATDKNASAPLPILVDEDWGGPLLDYVAQLLRLEDRVPTRKMIEVLGSSGDLCPVIDSLSERGMSDAVDRVADAVGCGAFTSVVVTSRQPIPKGKVWQSFKSITAVPLTAEQVTDYVAAYAPQDRRTEVLERIKPLITGKQSLSPLFLRFAIEQALAGPVTSASTLDLVLQYVEALRSGKIDLSTGDMMRAASISAVESIRETLVPREIEQSYLRGVLVNDADPMAFMNVKNDKSVDPAAIIEMLVECGLLNRNRTNQRLQFAYDPVAEQLAAHAMVQGKKDARTARLRKRILSDPDSAVAHAMGEIEMTAGSR